MSESPTLITKTLAPKEDDKPKEESGFGDDDDAFNNAAESKERDLPKEPEQEQKHEEKQLDEEPGFDDN